jgi:hypothetical protein
MDKWTLDLFSTSGLPTSRPANATSLQGLGDGPWPSPLPDGPASGKSGPPVSLANPYRSRASAKARLTSGMLRGLGNAIVPQVAAAFVSAFLDAEVKSA